MRWNGTNMMVCVYLRYVSSSILSDGIYYGWIHFVSFSVFNLKMRITRIHKHIHFEMKRGGTYMCMHTWMLPYACVWVCLYFVHVRVLYVLDMHNLQRNQNNPLNHMPWANTIPQWREKKTVFMQGSFFECEQTINIWIHLDWHPTSVHPSPCDHYYCNDQIYFQTILFRLL